MEEIKGIPSVYITEALHARVHAPNDVRRLSKLVLDGSSIV